MAARLTEDSVLASTLFNLCKNNLPITRSRSQCSVMHWCNWQLIGTDLTEPRPHYW